MIWVIKCRRVGLLGYVAQIGGRGGAYKVLMRKPQGKRQLGRPRQKWRDDIKMDLQGMDGRVWRGCTCLSTGAGRQLL
jgi:hypothetical protein